MSQAVLKAQLGQVVALLSTTLDADSTKASTALSALNQKVQDSIHGKLWEVMGRPDYHHYGSIAFTDPSKLPENLRPTPEQRFAAVNNYLMTFPSYITSLQRSLMQMKRSLTQMSSSPAIAPLHAALPEDLMLNTFSFLSPEDLARASGVCKEWRTLASTNELWQAFDLKKICKVIDEAVWERHADLATLELDASGAPAIDKRNVIPFIKRLSRQVEGNAGVTLLTMPKGLTLNKLIELAAAPKQGHATRFSHIWHRLEEEFGNVAVDKTHTVAITRSVLKESRNKSFVAKRALAQGNGGDLPRILPAATLAFLTYVSSPEWPPTRLYGDEPRTFMHCSEQINGTHFVVGGFAPEGLYADGILRPNDVDWGATVAKKL